jgi:hypothetical protein
MLTFLVQFGNAHLRDTPGNPLQSVEALVIGVCAGALLLQVLRLLVPRLRVALRSRFGRRRRRPEVANAERRARALMSELCPHGWRAQIALIEGSDDQLPVGPTGERSRVVLEWTEFEDESGRAAVSRRVWAPTIAEALEAMVADRRTDETLEQIERGALADGAPWQDL